MKIFLGIVGVLLGLLALLAIVISYDADCLPGPVAASGDNTMQAITYSCYGPPQVLKVSRLVRPEPGPGEVLVRIKAASVNPADWHYMRGAPYFMRLMSGIGGPKDTRLGTDFAGVVEAVGEEVTLFQPGDTVFGGAAGAFSEYVVRSEERFIVRMPAGVSFAEAAALPIAGLTALQALRDKGQLQPGEHVLINGASGGVGGYAVQIAKSMGATVTGVCSTRNVERVLALGADQVVDYKQLDYTEQETRYDLVIDLVGNHSVLANRRVLAADGRMVMVAGGKGDWIGPLENLIMAAVVSPFVDQTLVSLLARFDNADLETLAAMMASGELRSEIDRHYPLDQVAEAMAYSESGRARGKIILDVD